MTDHASAEYLDGLSPLDQARATVAVRWLGYGLALQSRRKDLGLEPIEQRGIKGSQWGTSWQGTASLMELAEAKGWEISGLGKTHNWLVGIHNGEINICREADTIHAAVLLACAAAVQREESK